MAGYKFRRQMVIEPYIVDFACIEARVIIEVDGGQHNEQKAKDAKRTMVLESMDYTVIRFWNNEVLSELNAVLERIHACLKTREH